MEIVNYLEKEMYTYICNRKVMPTLLSQLPYYPISFPRWLSGKKKKKKKNTCLPMQETQVQSLGQEDPLEKETGNPLQYSCLGNPIGREAKWASVYGVEKNPTQESKEQ